MQTTAKLYTGIEATRRAPQRPQSHPLPLRKSSGRSSTTVQQCQSPHPELRATINAAVVQAMAAHRGWSNPFPSGLDYSPKPKSPTRAKYFIRDTNPAISIGEARAFHRVDHRPRVTQYCHRGHGANPNITISSS